MRHLFIHSKVLLETRAIAVNVSKSQNPLETRKAEPWQASCLLFVQTIILVDFMGRGVAARLGLRRSPEISLGCWDPGFRTNPVHVPRKPQIKTSTSGFDRCGEPLTKNSWKNIERLGWMRARLVLKHVFRNMYDTNNELMHLVRF